jgi:hypothetical protein
MSTRIMTGIILLWAGLLQASSQEKIQPPDRATTPVDSVSTEGDEKLPAIDLPEYQITGNERVDLPQFTKPAVHDDRGLAPVDDATPGLRDPAEFQPAGVKQELGFDAVPRGLNGRLTVGYGSFATPFFEGWFGRTAGDLDLLLKAGYTSSEGHVANTDHRNGRAGLSLGWTLPGPAGMFAGARMDARVGMRGDGYRLFGSSRPNQARTVNRFRADVSIQSALQDLFEYTATARLHGVTLTDRFRSRQTSLGWDIAAERQTGMLAMSADAAVWFDFTSAPSAGSEPYFVHGSLDGTYPLGGGVTARAGLGLYLFRGTDDQRKVRVAPLLGLSWFPAEGVTVFGRFEPSVERRTFGTLLEQNPYIINDVTIRHEERPIYLTGGAEVDIATGVKARMAMEYLRVRSFPLYVDEALEGLWRPEYGGVTRIVTLRWDLEAEIGGGHTVSSSLTFQGARNSLTSTTPTYFPSVLISGMYQYRFPFGLSAGGSVRVVGRQSTDLRNTRTVPAFTLVDLTAAYVIIPGLSVNATVQNLLNPSYSWWEGYRAQPRGVAVSLSHSW